jgi:hypothetical protein
VLVLDDRGGAVRVEGWYWCHSLFGDVDRWEIAYWSDIGWAVTHREYLLSDTEAGFVEFVGPLEPPRGGVAK